MTGSCAGLPRIVAGLAVCASAWLLPAPAAAQAPLTLAAAMDRAFAANPTIAAARLRGAVSQRALGVAGEYLNPELHAELEREAPTQAYTMAFPLELGDKRGRRVALAEATIQVTQAELDVALADTRASVRGAYFARVVAELRGVLLAELQTIAGRARDTAQQRFEAGDAPRLEVLQADLAKAEANNQAAAAHAAANGARVTLNALLAFPLDAPTPIDLSLDGALPALDAALSRARSASSELALLDRRLEEQRARVALAKAMQTPDITPEAAVTFGQPEFTTGWRAAVTIEIPLFTRHTAGVALEDAALAQLAAEREAVASRIAGDVTAAGVTADALRQLFLRYQTQIIPQALEVERMAEDAYQLGQTGIAEFLQALQASRDVRLRSLQAATDLQTALADLERAVGAPLP